jgi:hypothetical protein
MQHTLRCRSFADQYAAASPLAHSQLLGDVTYEQQHRRARLLTRPARRRPHTHTLHRCRRARQMAGMVGALTVICSTWFGDNFE